MFSLNLIKYQTYASQSVPTLSWTNPENVESACEFKSQKWKASMVTIQVSNVFAGNTLALNQQNQRKGRLSQHAQEFGA